MSRVLSQRGKTSLEAERENFEKSQTTSLHKAINNSEVPVKEKHARTAIIGTFQEKGAGMFWSTVNRLPLQGNPIVCWKFLCVLHKMLRDGHKNVIVDSMKYKTHIEDLGKLWGHLREGYGKLIAAFTKLMAQKLTFHKKNPNIPGNLVLTDDQLDFLAGRDPNGYFELSVEMLDYMDEILSLQKIVFGSLDMSRSNSMTSTGQCRLSPLILCIQDSCALYDYIVKLLFKLHGVVPPDTLVGHRDRFLKQYKGLKDFYTNSRNLQYFKHLIQVPVLPDNPPNFLIASDFASHVTPKVILPAEPEPEPEPEPETADLVDMNETFGNGAPSPPVPDEKDRLIEQLMAEIERLKQEKMRIKSQAEEIMRSLHRRIEQLEEELRNREAQYSKKEAEYEKEQQRLKRELADGQKNAAASVRLVEVEKTAKANEEKFKKMKDIYGKLREEHVQLIRKNAETTKQLAAGKQKTEEAEEARKSAVQELQQMQTEQKVLSENLQKSADEVSNELATTTARKEQLEREKEELEEKFKTLETEHGSLDENYKQLQDKVDSLTTQLETMTTDKEELEEEKKSLDEKLKTSGEENAALEGKVKEVEASVESLTTKLEDMTSEKEKLEKTKQELETKLATAEEEKVKLGEDLTILKSSMDSSTAELGTVAADKAQLEKDKKSLEEKLESLEGARTSLEASLKEAQTNIASLTEQLGTTTANKEQLEKDKQSLEEQCNTLNSDKATLEGEVQQIKSNLAELQDKLNQALKDKETADNEHKKKISDFEKQMLVCAITEGENLLNDALGQMDNMTHNAVMGTAEFLLHRAEPVVPLLTQLKENISTFSTDKTVLEKVITSILQCSHGVGETILQGKATANSAANVEQGDELTNLCHTAVKQGIEVLSLLKNESFDSVPGAVDKLNETMNSIITSGEALLPKVADIKAKDMADMVEQEMHSTEQAIEQAAKRIQEMLDKARESHSGIQLEVNEQVLDSCTGLMQAIRILVEKSKSLQREIVAQGRGTTTAKDFYKKHHRWTEGLISAAKAVGWGANVLVDAADKVVKGEGKFEELMVCSQEIAASTAQLVVSSKVKAERDSKALAELSTASKGVTSATGNVVASAKNAAAKVEEQDTLDFSKLTLHQTKRLEMNSQVRVIELESALEKERVKLSSLRKQHYQLAGESEEQSSEA